METPPPKVHEALTQMAQSVRKIHKELRETSRPGPLNQALLGSDLLSAKLHLAHGVYSWWVLTYCGFSPRTGRRYIAKLRSYLEDKGLDWDLVLEDLKDLAQSLARRQAQRES